MSSLPMNWARTAVLTTVALIAFATNSLLCRVALGRELIDPATFTTIRLASGAVALGVIVLATRTRPTAMAGNWGSAFCLALYALGFSFAYTALTVGTGALILFAAVQATMMIAAMWAGERPGVFKWVGIAVAFSGLVYLVSPGLHAPPVLGAALMGCAGIAWGVYSLRGRGQSSPLLETAGNFLRAVPIVAAISIVTISTANSTWAGCILAIVSGALASGVGYVIWYAALRGLTTTRAATAQLLVPALAALAGVIFLAEDVTLRLILSSILILGGVALGLTGGRRSVREG